MASTLTTACVVCDGAVQGPGDGRSCAGCARPVHFSCLPLGHEKSRDACPVCGAALDKRPVALPVPLAAVPNAEKPPESALSSSPPIPDLTHPEWQPDLEEYVNAFLEARAEAKGQLIVAFAPLCGLLGLLAGVGFGSVYYMAFGAVLLVLGGIAPFLLGPRIIRIGDEEVLLEDDLFAEDARPGRGLKGQVLHLKIPAGRAFDIVLIASFPSWLALIREEQVMLDSGPVPIDSPFRARFIPPRAGLYRVVVGSLDGRFGSFRLAIHPRKEGSDDPASGRRELPNPDGPIVGP